MLLVFGLEGCGCKVFEPFVVRFALRIGGGIKQVVNVEEEIRIGTGGFIIRL